MNTLKKKSLLFSDLKWVTICAAAGFRLYSIFPVKCKFSNLKNSWVMLQEAELISFVSNVILSLSGNVTCSLLGLHTVLAMHSAARRSDVVEQDGQLPWLPLKKSTKTLGWLYPSLWSSSCWGNRALSSVGVSKFCLTNGHRKKWNQNPSGIRVIVFIKVSMENATFHIFP